MTCSSSCDGIAREQHGTLCPCHGRGGDRSERAGGEAAATVRAEADQAGVEALGGLADRVGDAIRFEHVQLRDDATDGLDRDQLAKLMLDLALSFVMRQ